MALASYVIVSTDPADKSLYGGPMRWDGESPIAVPAGRQLMLAATAQASGYAYTEERNTATLRDSARAALVGNTSYLAMPTRTNADVAVQVLKLTRQNNALIRLVIGALDTTDGT